MNRVALEEISQFVDRAQDQFNGMSGYLALPYHEIPTGLVFAGINTPDHDTQFQQIASHLREPTSPLNKRKRANYVSLLHSKDCSNVKSMMKHMIAQFVDSNLLTTNDGDDADQDREEEEEEEEEDPQSRSSDVLETPRPVYRLQTSGRKPTRLPNYDMQILEGWYKHITKHHHDQGSLPNLAIILQDFESFEPLVLQDFIAICSEYRLRLPICFVIGVATSMETFQQSLTKFTLSQLRIEKFWLQQSDVWFNRILEKIFLEESFTLKFGCRPYKFLLDHFYLYDFSIGKVTASIKYALMHHFYANPLSIFLTLLYHDKTSMQKITKEWYEKTMLGEHHFNRLRMLSSFRTHVEKLAGEDPSLAYRLLTDDQYLLTEAIPNFLCSILRYQREFKLGLELLHVLQAQFPSFSALRKSKRMLLLEALESPEGLNGEKGVTKWLVNLIRKLEPEALGDLLDQLREWVESDPENMQHHKEEIAFLDDLDNRLNRIMEGSEAFIQRMERKRRRLEGMVLPDLEKRRSTQTAQRVQQESIEHLKQKGAEWSKIAMDVADWCNRLFATYLRSYTELPMHELVYYNTVRLHEKSLEAQPRATIQTALMQSNHYLHCDCCADVDPDQIWPTEHDTCILYKLYNECGRMINLYDWFVAFSCIIEREKRSDKRKLDEKEIHARFIRSVAELQFLGFIKPTQRKTDHVIRLTWSNM
ncbi:origin recognition complex subunit 3 N-terminus-domain-containing protein [Radiomyces spectabilis]|uniref:origin recognition complex subunit 3 N-terminus-domain-containing protein n=1 Tax=Radiomyces spectabilis TaxID=64574 RepID=UPI00221EEBB9|nr:origin recognition complex subunit 3 N-terminus-domain-containing protein [Radiomyces spectabilis]KAI8381334.1 origin recognition complex subunit 3 N-terminus-domain-containing protein [Radiomyces spectabilis]